MKIFYPMDYRDFCKYLSEKRSQNQSIYNSQRTQNERDEHQKEIDFEKELERTRNRRRSILKELNAITKSELRSQESNFTGSHNFSVDYSNVSELKLLIAGKCDLINGILKNDKIPEIVLNSQKSSEADFEESSLLDKVNDSILTVDLSDTSRTLDHELSIFKECCSTFKENFHSIQLSDDRKSRVKETDEMYIKAIKEVDEHITSLWQFCGDSKAIAEMKEKISKKLSSISNVEYKAKLFPDIITEIVAEIEDLFYNHY